MDKILKKVILAPAIRLFEIENPLIAEKVLPGQFIVLRAYEQGEKIPMTVADSNKEKGTITIIFQEVGKSTITLGTFEEGQEILDIVGPLGKPSEIEKFGTVVCVGGGIGTAPLYPIIRAMKKASNKVVSILGARNKESIILEKEVRNFSDEVYINTDDGSYGRRGFVSEELKRFLKKNKADRVVVIGPPIMMKVVSQITALYSIKTIVSLNPLMIDGTGMCGACRVEIGDKTMFACVDGPEFDGHLVNFDLLIKRLATYSKEEKEALEHCMQHKHK